MYIVLNSHSQPKTSTSMQSLKGKVVAITGASRGIGAAMARRFAAEDVRLVICARRLGPLRKLARSLSLPPEKLLVVAADVSTPRGMAKFVQGGYRKFGRIDLFINNVGVWGVKPIDKITDEEFERLIATNIASVFYSFRALIPLMKKQKGGEIINISSGAGRIPIPGLAVYCASKAAVNMLTAATLREVRNDNIKISVLAPGPVNALDTPAIKRRKYAVTAEQVADAAVALARQDKSVHSWLVDIRPLITDAPFV